MLDTIMENEVGDCKVTFIELQTVKKDEPFEGEDCLPVELQPPFPLTFVSTGNSVAEKVSYQNSLHDVPSHTVDLQNGNEKEDVKDSKEPVGSESDSDYSSSDPSMKNKNATSDSQSGKIRNKKKMKRKSWNSSPCKKNSCVKVLKKKKKKKSKKANNVLPDKSSSPEKNEDSSLQKKRKCEYPRLCSGCGHAYKTKQSFWNHKQRCAMLPQNSMRNVAVDENGVPIGGAAGSNFVRRKEYICAHCDRRYRKKYNLQEHLKNTCRGKPCSKGRLQCWEEGCMQAFYKYVDLVQHVTLQHGQDLQIQKLSFPNLTAFNSWKTEESNSKFMYARKITGSKRFSNTKYHYFVCQFNHRNEKKNNNRKTNRRKSVNLVVPNYNCPSRIMVKECENQIQVTYISSHNHELNLANVKYQPLEKETRAYIKTLLQLGVSAKRIKDHLQEGVGNPEIDSFLATKQHFLTLNRIKRMESKLKAKNRAQQVKEDRKDVLPDYSCVEDESFLPRVTDEANNSIMTSRLDSTQPPNKDSDDVVRSIESNLKKLKGYMHKSTIKEKLSDRISKMIQELCDECEHMENTDDKSVITRKPRSQNTSRKRKMTSVDTMSLATAIAPAVTATTVQLHPQIATVETHEPTTHMHHQMQPILVQQQEPIQSHIILQQPITIVDQSSIMANVITNVIRSDKSFTPPIHENTDVLKPIYQPYNVNLLCLKSIDPYIPEREQMLLSRVDECFSAGYLCDATVNSFLDLVCQPMSNVIAASTGVSEFVQLNQKVPDVWHCYNWSDIDTLFIPCNPSKKQWFLLILLVKNSELQILDPASVYDTMPDVYKKYESSIQCWYSVLHNFMGISQCNLTFPVYTKNDDPINSGVLICWYVFQYINKRNLGDNVDMDIFRKYIYNTIVSTSSPIMVDVPEIR